MHAKQLRQQLSDNRNSIFIILLILILLIGLILRLKSIWFGYPLITHPDEPQIVGTAEKIIKNMDLNPHFFNYPSFVIYLQVATMTFFAAVNYICFNVSPIDIPHVDFYIAGRAVASIRLLKNSFLENPKNRCL